MLLIVSRGTLSWVAGSVLNCVGMFDFTLDDPNARKYAQHQTGTRFELSAYLAKDSGSHPQSTLDVIRQCQFTK